MLIAGSQVGITEACPRVGFIVAVVEIAVQVERLSVVSGGFLMAAELVEGAGDAVKCVCLPKLIFDLPLQVEGALAMGQGFLRMA